MNDNGDVVFTMWKAFSNARGRGHDRYVALMERCERYTVGDQWDPKVVRSLGDRPALTVNMILATLSTAFGQMLENYTEISFYAKDVQHAPLTTTLKTVMKSVYQDTSLRWLDMDMAMDGFVGGRGFLDVRMSFAENLRGDVSIAKLDPRDVIIDPEARTPMPDGWKEVFITRWLTLDEIESVYGKGKADQLRDRPLRSFANTYDMVQSSDMPGTIGGPESLRPVYIPPSAYADAVPFRFRVVERQCKKLVKRAHFVDLGTGETRPVPGNWSDKKVRHVIDTSTANGAMMALIDRTSERVRMTSVAADVVLYDDWSPYPQFTVVPYFPYFRQGKTMGVVENLLTLQDGLNKTFSQTLHVVNTTANSGWVIKSGSLRNMTVPQLESRGSETGLVVEVNGSVDDVKKIQPNSIPQGLDRLSSQISEWVKYVSGVSDSMRGFDRSDVAAKAVVANQKAGAISLAVPMESLTRTRKYLAQVILSRIQQFYTEPRVFRIAPDSITGREDSAAVNQPSGGGMLLNDLTLGEYSVSIKYLPPKETADQSQFVRAIEMLNAGIPVPDWLVLSVSGLDDADKAAAEIMQARESQSQVGQLEAGKVQAETAAKNAEAANKQAQARLLQARAVEVGYSLQGVTPKDKQAMDITQLQTSMQREKMYIDDDFRNRKLLIDTLSAREGDGDTNAASSPGPSASPAASPGPGPGPSPG